jgi:branched-subunit amino acid ABC-type transport system permease component
MINNANLTQSMLNGLTLSAIYIMVSLGLTLILSIMNIVQMAHGEIYMIGAYLVLCFTGGFHLTCRRIRYPDGAVSISQIHWRP